VLCVGAGLSPVAPRLLIAGASFFLDSDWSLRYDAARFAQML
jgi:hypothetical protein